MTHTYRTEELRPFLWFLIQAHFQPEQTPEFSLPGLPEWEYDFSPDMQHIFTNSHINELNGFQFQSDANEQEEDDIEFVNSLFVDQDDIFRGRAKMNQGQAEMMNFNRFREAKSLSKVYFSNGGLSSDTDTDTDTDTAQGLVNIYSPIASEPQDYSIGEYRGTHCIDMHPISIQCLSRYSPIDT